MSNEDLLRSVLKAFVKSKQSVEDFTKENNITDPELIDSIKNLKENTDGKLLTSGEAFENTYSDFLGAKADGSESESTDLIAVIKHGIISKEDDFGVISPSLILTDTSTETVMIRNDQHEYHMSLSQVDSVIEGLTIAKEALLAKLN